MDYLKQVGLFSGIKVMSVQSALFALLISAIGTVVSLLSGAGGDLLSFLLLVLFYGAIGAIAGLITFFLLNVSLKLTKGLGLDFVERGAGHNSKYRLASVDILSVGKVFGLLFGILGAVGAFISIILALFFGGLVGGLSSGPAGLIGILYGAIAFPLIFAGYGFVSMTCFAALYCIFAEKWEALSFEIIFAGKHSAGMHRLEVKGVGAVSLGKLQVPLFAVIGLLYGSMLSIFSSTPIFYALLPGLGTIGLLLPIILPIIGFILGAACALLYNATARLVGGLELDFG